MVSLERIRHFKQTNTWYKLRGRLGNRVSRLTNILRIELQKSDDLRPPDELASLLSTDGTIEYYNRAIKARPHLYRAHFFLGCIWRDEKLNYENAVTQFELAIDKCPGNFENYFHLGLTFFKISNFSEALHAFQRAAIIQSEDASAYFHMGSCLEALGKYAEAAEMLKKATSLNPGDLGTIEFCARTLFVSGKTSEAEEYWQKTYDLERKGRNEPKDTIFLGPIWVNWIGHIALYLDMIIKQTQLGMRPHRKIVILAEHHRISNLCLLEYYKAYVQFVTDKNEIERVRNSGALVHDFIHFTELGSKCVSIFTASTATHKKWESSRRGPLIALNEDHKARGLNLLRDLGIPENAWYVCLHVRESGFWRERDCLHAPRDAKINSYQLGISEIVNRGGWVLRLGDPTMHRLKRQAGVIDYAHSRHKSDWMDIFLAASCRFMIGTNSGISMVPHSFGIPTLFTNWVPIGKMPFSRGDLIVPKLLRDTRTRKNLSFADMMAPECARVESGTYFSNRSLECIPNTQEEIAEAVKEMLEQTEKNQITTHSLSDKFDLLLEKNGHQTGPRTSPSFIARHKDLLGMS